MNKTEAVLIIIENDEGQILSVSRKNDHTDFGFPGGKIEDGENTIQAIARELQEETGLILESCKYIDREEYENDTVHVFLAISHSGEIYTTEDHIVKWCYVDELIKSPTFGERNERRLKKNFFHLFPTA